MGLKASQNQRKSRSEPMGGPESAVFSLQRKAKDPRDPKKHKGAVLGWRWGSLRLKSEWVQGNCPDRCVKSVSQEGGTALCFSLICCVSVLFLMFLHSFRHFPSNSMLLPFYGPSEGTGSILEEEVCLFSA